MKALPRGRRLQLQLDEEEREAEIARYRDAKTRKDQIRRAGDKSRRRERERKQRLAAETAAILANPAPQLRKEAS
jgi:hypothetical protein